MGKKTLKHLSEKNKPKITEMVKINKKIKYWLLGQMSRVFANGPVDWGSILGQVITKTQKMVLDATLLNTEHYKVQIKSKMEQSREWSSALAYTLV